MNIFFLKVSSFLPFGLSSYGGGSSGLILPAFNDGGDGGFVNGPIGGQEIDDRNAGEVGGGVSCGNVLESVSSVIQETVYESQCTTVPDHQCQKEVQTGFSTQLETQCVAAFSTKCKPVYKTAYRKFCTTVGDTECRTTSQTTHKTVYQPKCSTVYTKVCHDAGYGKQKCSSEPKEQCHQVASQVPQTNPIRQCNSVPKEKCHQVPQQVQVQKCFHIPQQDCTNVPVQGPVAVPVEKCRAIPRRHCQSVPVKRPRVVTKTVPRQICVTSGGLGGGGGFGGAGGFGGHGATGYAGGAGVGGFADHRKDDLAVDDIISSDKT